MRPLLAFQPLATGPASLGIRTSAVWSCGSSGLHSIPHATADLSVASIRRRWTAHRTGVALRGLPGVAERRLDVIPSEVPKTDPAELRGEVPVDVTRLERAVQGDLTGRHLGGASRYWLTDSFRGLAAVECPEDCAVVGCVAIQGPIRPLRVSLRRWESRAGCPARPFRRGSRHRCFGPLERT